MHRNLTRNLSFVPFETFYKFSGKYLSWKRVTFINVDALEISDLIQCGIQSGIFSGTPTQLT